MVGSLARISAYIVIAVISFLSVIELNASVSSQASQRSVQTLISIPSIEVLAPIVPIYPRNFEDGSSTWDTRELSMNVGRLVGLPAFGEGGNVVLGGHSELEPGEADVFYNLEKLQIDDVISIEKGRDVFHYRVSDVRIVGVDDLSILNPSSEEILTLMTCDPESYDASNNLYETRIVVVARRIL